MAEVSLGKSCIGEVRLGEFVEPEMYTEQGCSLELGALSDEISTFPTGPINTIKERTIKLDL